MGILLANNAASTLNGAILSTDTSIVLTDASSMPTPGTGEWFNLTLTQASSETSWEVVKVTARSGNTLTVVRGQDGTTAAGWASGSVASCRANAQTLLDLSGGILGQISGPELSLTGLGSASLRAAYSAAGKSVGGVAVTAGDLIIVGQFFAQSLVAETCADNASGSSNTYNEVGTGHGWTTDVSSMHIHYAIAKATETLTVTVTSADLSNPFIVVHVVKGANQTLASVLDAYNWPGEDTLGTSHTTGTATATVANDYLFSVVGNNYAVATYASTSGFTQQEYLSTGDMASFDATAGAPGTYANTYTTSASALNGRGIAAFKSTVTATIGRMHVCSGTSADYTVTLPPVAGNAGRFIGFRMAPGLTKLVTLKGNAAETIDGSNTRIMWANEAAILYCDGVTWTKVAGKTIPMMSMLGYNTTQTFSAGAITLLPFAVNIYNNAPAAFQTTGTNRFTILRPGAYNIKQVFMVSGQNASQSSTVGLVYKNGANLKQFSASLPASAALMVSNDFPASLTIGDYLQPYGYYASGSYATAFLNSDSGAGTFNAFSITEIPTW